MNVHLMVLVLLPDHLFLALLKMIQRVKKDESVQRVRVYHMEEDMVQLSDIHV